MKSLFIFLVFSVLFIPLCGFSVAVSPDALVAGAKDELIVMNAGSAAVEYRIDEIGRAGRIGPQEKEVVRMVVPFREQLVVRFREGGGALEGGVVVPISLRGVYVAAGVCGVVVLVLAGCGWIVLRQ